MPARATVLELYPRLIDGDIGVLTSFCERATVDSPLGGKQLPPEFVAETRAWLAAHDARVADVCTTETPGRVVHEITLWLEFDGNECELPIMLIADIADGCIRDLRDLPQHVAAVRHARGAPRGARVLQPGRATRRAGRQLPRGPRRRRCRGRRRAFEPDGVVREPSGSAFAHAGADRTAWYERILSDGGIALHLGSITDDGATVVFEYLADRWGSQKMPAQAGAAAYTRGAKRQDRLGADLRRRHAAGRSSPANPPARPSRVLMEATQQVLDAMKAAGEPLSHADAVAAGLLGGVERRVAPRPASASKSAGASRRRARDSGAERTRERRTPAQTTA